MTWTVNKAVEFYFRSLAIQTGLMLITVAAIAMAIVETYVEGEDFKDIALSLEIFFFCAFFVDLCLDFIRAQFKLDYILSLTFFYDITACLSLLWVFYPKNEWLIFFRFFRVFKIIEVVKLRHYATALRGSRLQSTDVAAFETTAITYFVARLIVNIVAFVILSTAAVYAVSISNASSFGETLTFGGAFYFIVVTVTTVGFGDISPIGIWPQLLVVVIIIFAFSVFPFQVSEMVTAMHVKGNRNIESFKSRRHTEHIVICGLLDYESLYVIASQVLPPHAGDFGGLVLCILSPAEPSPRVSTLLAVHKQYIQFLIGSSKSFNDLRRSKAHKARAIIVLPDIAEETSLREEEDSVFLSAVAITKYLDLFTYHEKNNEVPGTTAVQPMKAGSGSLRYPSQRRARPRVIVKLTSSARNRPVLLASGVDCVVAVAELRYTLLAFGSAMPGFIAMFNALIGWSHDIKRMSTTDADADGRHHSIQTLRQIQVESFPAGIRALPWSRAVLECFISTKGALTLVGAKKEGSAPVGAVRIPPPDDAVVGSFECVFTIGDVQLLESASHGAEDRHPQGPPTRDRGARTVDADDHDNRSGNAEEEEEEKGRSQTDKDSPEDEFTGAALMLRRAFSASKRRAEHVPYRSPSFQSASLHVPDPMHHNASDRFYNGGKSTLLQRLPSDSAIDAHEMTGSFYFGAPKHIAPLQAPDSAAPSTPSSSASAASSSASSRSKEVTVLNRFVAADVAGASRGRAGKRFLPATLKAREGSRLTGHILVAITATSAGKMPPNAIMLPLLYFLRCLRSITGDSVVILCDRAEELVSLVPEVELVSPGVMTDVHFVHGHSRNPDHLNLVNAEKARAAVIIRPPLASEQSQEGVREKSFVAQVGADKDTIITSLNLHLLLEQSKRLVERTPEAPLTVSVSGEDIRLSPSNSSRRDLLSLQPPSISSSPPRPRRTHILVEIVHESNGKFLRQNHRDDRSAVAATHLWDMDDSPEEVMTRYHNALSLGLEDNGFADSSISFLEELDLPMLQAGRIHSHLTLDTLSVQAIFEPHVLAFWETALGLSSDPLLKVADQMAWDEGSDREDDIDVGGGEEDDEEGLRLSGGSEDDEEEHEEQESEGDEREAKKRAPQGTSITQRPHFDLIALPSHLAYSTFGEAFVWLYSTHAATAVAVHRTDGRGRGGSASDGQDDGEREGQARGDLPVVLSAPLPSSLRLLPSDEIFLIL